MTNPRSSGEPLYQKARQLSFQTERSEVSNSKRRPQRYDALDSCFRRDDRNTNLHDNLQSFVESTFKAERKP